MNPVVLILAITVLAILTGLAGVLAALVIKNPDDIEMDRHRKFGNAFGDGK